MTTCKFRIERFGAIILFILSQMGCAANSVPVPKGIVPATLPSPFTLPEQNEDSNLPDDTQLDLRDKSSILDVQRTTSGLVALTGFSKAGSYSIFLQRGEIWSMVTPESFAPAAGPDQGAINCISFLDGNGWAVDYGNRVWLTTNAGLNWNKIGAAPGNVNYAKCESLQFTSSSEGWLTNLSGLYKTEDGGKTWNKINGIAQGDGALVRFVDPKIGWAISVDDKNNSTVYATSNAGVSWAAHKLPRTAVYEFYPLTSNQGFLSAKRKLLKTFDGGSTLAEVSSLPESFAVQSVYCFDVNVCWVAGYYFPSGGSTMPRNGAAALLRTTDGGRTWFEIPITTSEHFFSKIKFFDAEQGVLAGQNLLYETTDGGQSWNAVLRFPSGE